MNFFAFPAEIRNNIYEMTLISPNDRIQVTHEFKTPGLLSVCRQIRQEAIQIYWLQNKFEVKVVDLDIKILVRFSMLFCTYESPKHNVDLKITVLGNGNSRWDRAVVWCEYTRTMSRMRRMQGRWKSQDGRISL